MKGDSIPLHYFPLTKIRRALKCTTYFCKDAILLCKISCDSAVHAAGIDFTAVLPVL